MAAGEGWQQVRGGGGRHVLRLDVAVAHADGVALLHGLQQLEGEPLLLDQREEGRRAKPLE